MKKIFQKSLLGFLSVLFILTIPGLAQAQSHEILTAKQIKSVRSFVNGTVGISIGALTHTVEKQPNQFTDIYVLLTGKNAADCANYARLALLHKKIAVIAINGDTIDVDDKGHFRIAGKEVRSCAIR